MALRRWRRGFRRGGVPGTERRNRGSGIIRSDGGEGVGGGRSEFGDGLKDICRVWPWASEILANHVFEFLEGARFNIQLPIEILAHLAFHLVDLAELEHALADDRPGLVRVGVIAYHL